MGGEPLEKEKMEQSGGWDANDQEGVTKDEAVEAESGREEMKRCRG